MKEKESPSMINNNYIYVFFMARLRLVAPVIVLAISAAIFPSNIQPAAQAQVRTASSRPTPSPSPSLIMDSTIDSFIQEKPYLSGSELRVDHFEHLSQRDFDAPDQNIFNPSVAISQLKRTQLARPDSGLDVISSTARSAHCSRLELGAGKCRGEQVTTDYSRSSADDEFTASTISEPVSSIKFLSSSDNINCTVQELKEIGVPGNLVKESHSSYLWIPSRQDGSKTLVRLTMNVFGIVPDSQAVFGMKSASFDSIPRWPKYKRTALVKTGSRTSPGYALSSPENWILISYNKNYQIWEAELSPGQTYDISPISSYYSASPTASSDCYGWTLHGAVEVF